MVKLMRWRGDCGGMRETGRLARGLRRYAGDGEVGEI